MISVIFCALSALAAPAPQATYFPDACVIMNTKSGIVGKSLSGIAFKPADDEILVKGTMKDVTFTLKSKYTPNLAAEKFVINN